MRVVIAPSLMAFAATAAGLLVTSPAKGDKVDVSEPVTIKWQAVNTDPSSFSIYLVNQNVYPNTQELIAANVDSDKGSYKMKAMENIDKGGGYQINFVSDSDSGILAQSQQFKVTEPQASMSVDAFHFCFSVLDQCYELEFLGFHYSTHFYSYPFNIFFYDGVFFKCVSLFPIFFLDDFFYHVIIYTFFQSIYFFSVQLFIYDHSHVLSPHPYYFVDHFSYHSYPFFLFSFFLFYCTHHHYSFLSHPHFQNPHWLHYSW
ncbi:hypothetical protein NUU61_009927 [Penicillium alfredii]|uniref:Yeast cell wall synthesis Kre9/Knh1-like N-terminal domain-containing protein n=1 Tax=Penicillium alfredii TaxID=1506179 RepID=A0A9W9EH19_9EURO|nr:uncharacterized protein NUU61_009927 [Penicillium alfredii]KAJ5081663.1 hypothetical protein NUU61_009927 [Penicillium alfredii]